MTNCCEASLQSSDSEPFKFHNENEKDLWQKFNT